MPEASNESQKNNQIPRMTALSTAFPMAFETHESIQHDSQQTKQSNYDHQSSTHRHDVSR